MENELKHRLEMISDDLRVIREFIWSKGLADVFREPSSTSDEVWTNLNNIEIACDLSTDESLSWKLYSSNPKERLEYLRGEIRKERISLGELVELQSLAQWIEPNDVELLEAAGVPEFEDEKDTTK
jgi:hypothetical protein